MQRPTAATILCTLLLPALGLCLGAAQSLPAKSAPGKPAATPTRHHPRRAVPWREIYPLTLDEGTPVLKRYVLDGYTLHPVLDTGSPAGLIVPQRVYTHLPVRSSGPTQIGSMTGKSSTQDAGVVLATLLGSGSRRWFLTTPMDAVETGEEASSQASPQASGEPAADSIFPLSIMDGELAIFLLSRKQLWVGNPDPDVLGPGVAGESDTAAQELGIKYIPYFDTSSSMLVTLTCEGHHFFAILDTGATDTTFSANFVAQHPALFKATGKTEQSYGFNAKLDLPSFHYDHGITLMGSDATDDIAFPPGDYDAMPEFCSDGSPVGPAECGDPSALPYERQDTPEFAPVALIGMDFLGKFDFGFYRADKVLLLWPPSSTPQMFPEVQRRPHRRHAAHTRPRCHG